jgi:hypothetical protein
VLQVELVTRMHASESGIRMGNMNVAYDKVPSSINIGWFLCVVISKSLSWDLKDIVNKEIDEFSLSRGLFLPSLVAFRDEDSLACHCVMLTPAILNKRERSLRWCCGKRPKTLLRVDWQRSPLALQCTDCRYTC